MAQENHPPCATSTKAKRKNETMLMMKLAYIFREVNKKVAIFLGIVYAVV